jgi:hypothetical protein
MTHEQIIAGIYSHGMKLAGLLRMLGKDEEAHNLELWILEVKATGDVQ